MYNSKKDIELSPEEALLATRRQCAPYWYNSEPLIVGILDAETKKSKVYPIDLEFPKFPWIIFFIDLTSPTYESTLKLANEWNKRFGSLQLKTLFIVKESYHFFKERLIMRPLFEKIDLKHPVFIDIQNAVQKAFKIKTQPSVVLFDREKTLFASDITADYYLIEKKIHDFLRSSDPGLPLKPFLTNDISILQLDFNLLLGKSKTPNDKIVIEKTLSEIKSSEVHFVGDWRQDKDCIFTSDENAQIHFHAQCSNIQFFCRSLNKNEEISRVYIQIDDGPVFDLFSGKDMHFDDENRSFLNVREAQLYSVLNQLPEDKRAIKCTVPWAKKSTFSLYRICGYQST